MHPLIDAGMRPAGPGDVDAIRSCVRAAYAMYVERMGQEPAPMQADYGALVAAGDVYVLPGGADILAVVVMRPEDGALFLENIAVHPNEQGRGLGTLLMRAIETTARSLGLSKVRLYTNEAMTENIAFYTRLGFEETDRRVDEGFRRVFMRKRLT